MIRWVLVSKETGKAVSKTSFATKKLAEYWANEGEEPKAFKVVGRSDPFSDYLKQSGFEEK